MEALAQGFDIGVGDGFLKGAVASEGKAVLFGETLSFQGLADGNIFAEREGFVATVQGEHHGLGHAGVGGARRKAEVEVEVGVGAGDGDDPAFDDQNIVALAGDGDTDIAGAGDIADDAAGFQVARVNHSVFGAGDGDDNIGVAQARMNIVVQRDTGIGSVRRRLVQGDSDHARSERSRRRAGASNCAQVLPMAPGRADNRDFGVLQRDAHAPGGVGRAFDSRGDRVGIAGRDGDVQVFRDRDAAVADDGRKRAQADDLRAERLARVRRTGSVACRQTPAAVSEAGGASTGRR